MGSFERSKWRVSERSRLYGAVIQEEWEDLSEGFAKKLTDSMLGRFRAVIEAQDILYWDEVSVFAKGFLASLLNYLEISLSDNLGTLILTRTADKLRTVLM